MSVRGNSVLKLLDRAAGIPLLWALGRAPKRPFPKRVARIGVLRTAAIGDALLLSGILRDLRAAFPDADLALVTGEENAGAGMLAAHGVASHRAVPIVNVATAVLSLRAFGFDLLIDSGAWPRLDALLSALSGASFTIGFRTQGQHRHYAYDRTVEHSSDVHETENYRALLRAAGVGTAAPARISRDALPQLDRVPRQPFIVFHPWPGGFRRHLREWPARRWVELAVELRSLGARIVVTGAASDAAATEDLVRVIAAEGIEAESVAGRFGIREVGALLVLSMGLVSTNTGVMHLGALLGVPTVGLNGPTASRRWGPIGARAVAVDSAFPDCGFLDLGFEYDGRRTDCMLGITVDVVARAFRQVAS